MYSGLGQDWEGPVGAALRGREANYSFTTHISELIGLLWLSVCCLLVLIESSACSSRKVAIRPHMIPHPFTDSVINQSQYQNPNLPTLHCHIQYSLALSIFHCCTQKHTHTRRLTFYLTQLN